MFEDFGLVVDFVPAVSEFLNQIGLDQPVAPDHGDGGGAAAVGQGDGSVAGVIDQALVPRVCGSPRTPSRPRRSFSRTGAWWKPARGTTPG